MKKIIFAMMLVSGINRQAIAQLSATDKTFEVPIGFVSNRYSIDLGGGNTLQIELSDKDDFDRIKNIDSILSGFFKDMVPFTDSLTDVLAAKRIDHVTDAAGRKKIRIRIFKPLASSFVIRQGEVAALKSEQDTVNIIGIVDEPTKFGLRKAIVNVRYFRLSFYVNDVNELKNADTKAITEKIAQLSSNNRWIKDKDGDWRIKNGDKSISAKLPNGTISGTGDYLASKLSTSIHNYRNNFVPSVSVGFDFVSNNGVNKTTLGFELESHFFFAKDLLGAVKTFQNNFFTLSYTQSFNNEQSVGFLRYNPNFSLSYLVKRRGDFYDKSTFRLGVGKVNLFKETVNVEPCFYFNNFFKNMTPSLKLSVGF